MRAIVVIAGIGVLRLRMTALRAQHHRARFQSLLTLAIADAVAREAIRVSRGATGLDLTSEAWQEHVIYGLLSGSCHAPSLSVNESAFRARLAHGDLFDGLVADAREIEVASVILPHVFHGAGFHDDEDTSLTMLCHVAGSAAKHVTPP